MGDSSGHPETSAAVAEVSRDLGAPGFAWKLGHSGWILVVVGGIVVFSWVGFAYCAMRVRTRGWILTAAAIFAGTVIALVGLTSGKGGSPWIAAVWLAEIALAFVANHWYLAWHRERWVRSVPARIHRADTKRSAANERTRAVADARAVTEAATSATASAKAQAAGEKRAVAQAARAGKASAKAQAAAEKRAASVAAKEAKASAKARLAELEVIVLAAQESRIDSNHMDLRSAMAEYRSLASPNIARKLASRSIRAAARRAISDDVVTVAEEEWLTSIADALGVEAVAEILSDRALAEEFVVGLINDGRPPTIDDPAMITKPGETAHAQFKVEPLKEVRRTAYRGGSSGVSVPIGLGIRLRVGSYRGRTVDLGTEMVPDDSGTLVITSARAVFVGQKKTLEFRHDRLVSVQQYSNGLRLGVSNRQAATFFKFTGGSPLVAAALLTYGAAKANS